MFKTIKFLVICFMAIKLSPSANQSVSAKPDSNLNIHIANEDDDNNYAQLTAGSAADDNYGEEAPANYELQNEKNPTSFHQSNHVHSSAYSHPQQRTALIKVFPQLRDPHRLDQIYQNQLVYNAYQVGNLNGNQSIILLYTKFPHDFSVVNPRNLLSQFRWETTGGGSTELADNAAFQNVLDGHIGAYRRTKHDSSHAHEETDGYTKLSSLPYAKSGNKEGYVVSKQTFAVGDRERLLLRGKIGCKIIDAENNPFNSTVVSWPYDDPRLANCQFGMSNANATSPSFFLSITNKSVWAVYTGSTFIAKRKVGVRKRYDTPVDLGLELDRGQAAVNYYVNGNKVWTISSIGAPPPDDGITKIDFGLVGTSTLAAITDVMLSFGTGKCLDESDPFQPNSGLRLVRIELPNSTAYGPNAVFYDAAGTYNNKNWGQGAIMTLYKFLILKTGSSVLRRQSEALPGVYGS